MKSDLHKSVYSIVKELYPNDVVLEEEVIKLEKQGVLYVDIYMPKLKIAIECDGIQHKKFNRFYHGDIFQFKRQQKNDALKDQYCQDNGITLVRVAYDEKIDAEKLSVKIIDALKQGT